MYHGVYCIIYISAPSNLILGLIQLNILVSVENLKFVDVI
jgi:hypothetical protein